MASPAPRSGQLTDTSARGEREGAYLLRTVSSPTGVGGEQRWCFRWSERRRAAPLEATLTAMLSESGPESYRRIVRPTVFCGGARRRTSAFTHATLAMARIAQLPAYRMAGEVHRAPFGPLNCPAVSQGTGARIVTGAWPPAQQLSPTRCPDPWPEPTVPHPESL